MYFARKNLVINGKPIRKGEPVPNWVDSDRLHKGLRLGHFTKQRADAAAPQAESPRGRRSRSASTETTAAASADQATAVKSASVDAPTQPVCGAGQIRS